MSTNNLFAVTTLVRFPISFSLSTTCVHKRWHCVTGGSVASIFCKGVKNGGFTWFCTVLETSVHSSRMRTAHLLTISPRCTLIQTRPGGRSPTGGRQPWSCDQWCVLGRGRSLPVNRMTHAFENITFPQLRLRAVNISFYSHLSTEEKKCNWLKFAVWSLPHRANIFTFVRLFYSLSLSVGVNGPLHWVQFLLNQHQTIFPMLKQH